MQVDLWVWILTGRRVLGPTITEMMSNVCSCMAVWSLMIRIVAKTDILFVMMEATK